MRHDKHPTLVLNRNGTIHVFVLISSLIVAAIGLASLQLSRLQSRTGAQKGDFLESRLCARAAIEIGILKIRNDPYWRTNLGNGNWLTNQVIPNGTFTLSAADPIDNDITKGDNHPVILTGLGVKGDSRFQTSVRLEVGARTGSCLEVSMTSGNDTTITSATLASDQRIAVNRNVSASSATVSADVEYSNSRSGSTYTKSSASVSTHNLPDSSSVFSYYQTNGVTISYSSLPQLQLLNMVDNSSFETDTSLWYTTGSGTCVLQRSTAQANQGSASLKVTSRSSNTVVAATNLSALNVSRINSGDTLSLSMPLFPTASGKYQAVITLISTGSGMQTYNLNNVNIPGSQINRWTDIGGSFSVSFTGTPTSATVSLSTPNANDFYLDGLSLTDTSYPSSTYYLDRVVLSPASNPFGATDNEGIYVIDCGSQPVIIQNCRIAGTLVLINTGSGSKVQGSVVWEPAVYNYPALMCDNTLQIASNSTTASESVLGFNMNPSGTPYPYIGGASNDTLTDAYSSLIRGLVYSAYDLQFSSSPSITGVVIANRNITVNATSLNLSYNSLYLNSPPPGFTAGTPPMKIVPGTWQRTVN